jgi:HSP20 family protein
MAAIVKKNTGQSEWSPFRAMRDFLRFDPFREMEPFQGVEIWNPDFEVTENKDGYVFKADLPGAKVDDITITATGNRLQIAGKREAEKEEKTDTVYTYERQYGTFSRAFTLPDGADLAHAKSELKDGVLVLVVPKLAETPASKIAISTEAKS